MNEFDFQKPKKAILLTWAAAGEAAADGLVVAATEGADDGLVEAVLEHAANVPTSKIAATGDSLLILTGVSLSR